VALEQRTAISALVLIFTYVTLSTMLLIMLK
jgi:hypothetical protein